VRLAMTHIPGESLNRFLDRRRAKAGLFAGSLYHRFSEACRFARELVAQLAPAFARISAIAYHRDVNPRNILVEERGSVISYGLIDFGLAVDATAWRLGTTQSSSGEAVIGAWQVFGVGGDCRYWPVSAWLMLEQGPKALYTRPQLCLEYKMHLDLHALGITALQVLMELTPAPPEAHAAGPDEALDRLWLLYAAWGRYWNDAMRFWRRLFDAYRKSGDGNDLAAVKAEYRSLAVHEHIGEDLRAIRAAIRDACEACQNAPPESGLQGAPPLFQALLAMISSGEDCARSSWRRVELLAEYADSLGFGVASPPSGVASSSARASPRTDATASGPRPSATPETPSVSAFAAARGIDPTPPRMAGVMGRSPRKFSASTASVSPASPTPSTPLEADVIRVT